MINISPTQSTNVNVTLYEKCNNILNPYFTWQIIDRNGYDTYIITSDDISTAPFYYNSFTISVGVGSATAGYFDGSSGEYHYYIYEKTNQYDLTILPSDNLVEVGILMVGPTGSTPISFTQSDDDVVNYFRNID